jgi:DNA repair ATPase RecN
MPERTDPELAVLLTELIEKVGLLRRDMQQKGDLEKYEARMARIEQKFSALAERISRTEPDLAKALRTAWQLPARSLAFRNADHQKELKTRTDQPPGPDRDEP